MGQNVTGSTSQVEIGQANIGIEGDKGLNFITASHQKGMEAGMPNFVFGRFNYGYSIREPNHTYPVGSNASQADISSKSSILTNLGIAKERRLQSGQIPVFKFTTFQQNVIYNINYETNISLIYNIYCLFCDFCNGTIAKA